MICAITCACNEADIIEEFIRINSRLIDYFLICDDSTDETPQVLNSLINEGFNIEIFKRESIGTNDYDQSVVMTSMLNFAASQKDISYVLPLDCDEFPTFLSRQDLMNQLGKLDEADIGVYKWLTYVPVLDCPGNKSFWLKDCFRLRLIDRVRYPKIIIPASLSNEVRIQVGSHGVTSNGRTDLSYKILEADLAHFPVRSAEQIISKNLQAVFGLLRKSHKVAGEGLHVYETFADIIHRGFSLTLSDLQKLAMSYANPGVSGVEIGPSPNWIPDYSLKYSPRGADIFGRISSHMLDILMNPIPRAELPGLVNALARRGLVRVEKNSLDVNQ